MRSVESASGNTELSVLPHTTRYKGHITTASLIHIQQIVYDLASQQHIFRDSEKGGGGGGGEKTSLLKLVEQIFLSVVSRGLK